MSDEIFNILVNHQKWRTGCPDTAQTCPRELTAALDAAMEAIKRVRERGETIKFLAGFSADLIQCLEQSQNNKNNCEEVSNTIHSIVASHESGMHANAKTIKECNNE